MKKLFHEYCLERYADWAHLSDIILESFQRGGKSFHFDEESFMIYEIEGDALIIHDMFVKKEFRRQKKIFSVFEIVKEKALEKKVRVIIGFSEKVGEGAEMGKRAMEYVGFVPFFETSAQTGYIRAA